jgi:hypothetical protein
MFNKTVLGLLILAIITGVAYTQESSTRIFNTDNSLNLSFIARQSFFNTQSNITLFTDEEQKPWGGNPVTAGFANIFFGIWSWTNKDYLGGVVTAGLYFIPLVIMLSPLNPLVWILFPADTYQYIALSFIGVASLVTAPIFGFIRGYTEYNKRMRTINMAEAFNDNLLKHISFVLLPTFNKRHLTGALMYSLSF